MLEMSRTLFMAQLAATWYMTGVIWMVQLVHYPLFDAVGRTEFVGYEQRNTALTTWVVGPPMIVEAIAAILAFRYPPRGVSTGEMVLGVVLLAVIWISTALLQVPCHNQLTLQFDEAIHRRLVVSNWIRTVAWTLRALLLFKQCVVS